MAWRKGLLAAVSVSAALAPAAAMAWTRSFVVEWFEPAMYYGGPANGAGDTPGSDCPEGVQPLNEWSKILVTPYRSQAQVDHILNPEFRGAGGNYYIAFGFRAPEKQNVYENPTAVADPKVVEVAGKIAEGFDLDGDPNTGFTSPDGVKGVDNAFYKATGCQLRFRGRPREAAGLKYSNDGMRDGVYTTVVVLSGDGADPMNDPDVTIGLYNSNQQMVKDANGAIAADYSFKLIPEARFQTVLKGASKNGVVETSEAGVIRTRDFWTPDFFQKELVLHKARARFELKPDGTAKGLIGGYRDWFEHYRGTAANGSTTAGAIHENVGHMNMPGWYYALRRNADGMPDAQGRMTGISTAYRMTLLPAYVMTPDNQPLQVARIF